MQLSNTPLSYGLLSRLLHWGIAALILGLVWLGWYMVDLSYYDKWYNASLHYHKTLGLLALALALCKLGWQWHTPAPGALPGLSPRTRWAARCMHALLWCLMLLLPVSGYLISTSAGHPVQLFNGLSLPALIDVDEQLKELAIGAHYYMAYGALALVAGHAGAALKHHFIDRDNTLKRMLRGGP